MVGHSARTVFPLSLALPPRSEQSFPTDRWLDAVHQAGYSHLCLQNDPFFHPEMDLRHSGENMFRLLSVFDLTKGPRHNSYLAWLRAIGERAGAHGLRLALQLWEPRLSAHAHKTLPATWMGSRGGTATLCLGEPDAYRWYLNGVRVLLEAAPQLNAIVLGINDNEAALCDTSCPRCAAIPVEERFALFARDMFQTCRQVRPDFQFVLYDWFWEQYDDVYAHLEKHLPMNEVFFLTRLERGSSHTPDPAHPQWTGDVFDMTMAIDSPGSDFRRAQERVKRVIVMLPVSGMFEAFQIPYVPAPGQMFRKFLRMSAEGVHGWMDYDCGGIHSGLMMDVVAIAQTGRFTDVDDALAALAFLRYGLKDEDAALAFRAWSLLDEATLFMPTNLAVEDVASFSGRFGVAMGLTPMLPFIPERGKIGQDRRHEVFWFDPYNFVTPSAIPAVIHGLRRALEHVHAASAALKELDPRVTGGFREAFARDREMVELTRLVWRSNLNFFEWADYLQGNAAIDIAPVLRSELQVTEAFKAMYIRPEVGIGNMTWAPERMLDTIVPEVHGDFFAVKERGLREQLSSLLV